MMLLDKKLDKVIEMCIEINIRCDDLQQRTVELDRMVTQIYDQT